MINLNDSMATAGYHLISLQKRSLSNSNTWTVKLTADDSVSETATVRDIHPHTRIGKMGLSGVLLFVSRAQRQK